jgi:hypothetical protein
VVLSWTSLSGTTGITLFDAVGPGRPFGGRWRERLHSQQVSWLSVPVLRGVAPSLLLAPLMLGEGPCILRTPTKLVRAIRLRSCQALTLSSHTIFGLGDLSSELT